MPTGLTSKVATGESTFEDFVWTCARQFGALIEMRDMPHDAEIPEEFKPSLYHLEARDEAMAELEVTINFSGSHCRTMADEEFKKNVESKVDGLAKNQKTLDNYDAMLLEVMEWETPSEDHKALKKLMMDQLKESREFDDSSKYLRRPISPVSGPDWRKQRIDNLEEMISYHDREQLEENERAEKRNLWVQQLRESLTNG